MWWSINRWSKYKTRDIPGRLTVIFVLLYAIKGDIPMSESAFHFPSSVERVNHLLFMDGLKLYTKNERGWDSLVQTVYIFSVD